MYDRNAASIVFDFKNLEEKKLKPGKLVRLPGKKARQKEKARIQKMFLASVFSVFLLAAVCVSGFVLGQVKLTEVSDAAHKASVELNKYKSTNTQLFMELKSAQTSNGHSFNSENN